MAKRSEQNFPYPSSNAANPSPRAGVWHGKRLHLYEVLGAFMSEGDVLGHEAMGVVEEVGPEVTAISPGDRVVIPFQVCCGHC